MVDLVNSSIQVFILAENRLLREALARILNKKNDIRVVASSAFGPAVVEQMRSIGPDVLLTDSAALALSELRLLREVQDALPSVKVVMIGMEPDTTTFLRAVQDGTVGYLLKDASALEVAAAVRAAANGEAICPSSLCLHLFRAYSTQAGSHPKPFFLRGNLGLTRREQQLVQLVSRGSTNKEIALELGLSEQTVKNHVHRILQKVGADDRMTMVEMCRAPGAIA
jgi:DNA-binding NarL/FixJ family response regulator